MPGRRGSASKPPQKPPRRGYAQVAIQDVGVTPEPVLILRSPSRQVAVRQVLRLGGAERLEQIEGGGRVVTPPVHVGDPLFLLADAALALGDVPIHLRDVPQPRRAIHNAGSTFQAIVA
jgi:hypothetical protein